MRNHNKMKSNNKFYKVKTPNLFSSHFERAKFPLFKLSRNIKELYEINQLVSQCVKDISNIPISVTRIDKGVVDIATQNQTDANHLIYIKKIIIEALNKFEDTKEVIDISVFVLHQKKQIHRLETNTTKETEISGETISAMKYIAQNEIRNTYLKQELLNLSTNLEKRKDSK